MSGAACVVRPKDWRSIMWMEGGGMGGRPTCEGTNARTNVRNRVCRVTVEHGLRRLAAALGVKSERRNAEGRKLELLMGSSVDSAPKQHRIASWTYRENWDDSGAWDQCLPSTRNEQSWASQASEKNEQFPLSCPQAVLQRRGGAIGRSSMATLEGKSLCITPFGLYPASSVHLEPCAIWYHIWYHIIMISYMISWFLKHSDSTLISCYFLQSSAYFTY